MTTYQDPPLQSRRASRQGERPEAQPSSPFAPPQVPRTAAGAGEPLSYVTQNRPPLPGYDSAPARGRRASEPAAAEPAVAESASQPAESEPQAPPSFRPRDYSPEARTAPPAWAPEHDRDNGVLDHHTQARAAVVPPAAGSLAASLASEPTEQTLSRRELRAIRDAAGITPDPAPTTPVSAQQAPAPAPSTQLDSAMAEFDALAGRTSAPEGSRRAGRRAAPPSDVAPEDGLAALDPALAAPAPVAPAPFQPAQFPQPAAVEPAAVEPAPVEPTAVEPVAVEPTPAAPAAFPPAPVPQASAPLPAPASPTTGERPVGHWTNQSDLDDAVQVTGSTPSRRVGSAAITTSALVLPSIPGHDMSTGEVMLTDSISLPSALSSTGAHHSIDESDIDHLLDPGDHQMVNTDSVPISAIRAVSSHTSTRGLIATAPPKKAGRALTALIISASVMVVVVVTLLVVALATEVI